jgi:Tol biopolymer transport system component
MAPEQLEGKEADTRTDIFAFGAVLHEMATGKPAFSGKTRASLIASILVSEPAPIISLQPLTPPMLERVVKTCLAKDPDARWQSAQDLKLQLQWILEGGSQAGVPAPVARRRKSREQLTWLLAGLVFLGSIWLGVREYYRASAPPVQARFALDPPEQHSFNQLSPVKVSPDGRKFAVMATDQEGSTSLWLRPLDASFAHQLPGTEGAWMPVWSPDSRFLLFVAESKLKRVDTLGGLPDVLCDAKQQAVQSWSSAGTVLLTSDLTTLQPAPIWQLNLDDCSANAVTKLDTARYDFGHQWPTFLPDGRHFVYAGLRKDKKHDVLLGMLGTETGVVLIRNASNPKYATPGYLLFERNGYLYSQPFSLGKLRLTGEPVQVVAEQLLFAGLGGIASYDVSSGVLVYQEQGDVSNQLLLLDSSGKEVERLTERGSWSDVRLSPDGKKLLASNTSARAHTSDLWMYDVQHKNWDRFSFESSPGNHVGVWSPDGQIIIYTALVKGNYLELYRKPVDRSREAEPLLINGTDKLPTDWSRDGTFLLYTQVDLNGQGDLWVLPMKGGKKPFSLTDTRFNEQGGRFSPDGRWIAYSNVANVVFNSARFRIRSFSAGEIPGQSASGPVGWSGCCDAELGCHARAQKVVHYPPGPFPERPLVFHVDSPLAVLMWSRNVRARHLWSSNAIPQERLTSWRRIAFHYSGVRPSPVTRRSQAFRNDLVVGCFGGQDTLKCASRAGLRVGAGRGS